MSIGTAVTSPLIAIRSTGIQLVGSGRLDAGVAGTVSLESTNTAGTFLNATANAAQPGYHLDEATLGKINASILNVAAGANAGGQFDLELGNIDFTASASLSQVNLSTASLAGGVRIGGEVRFVGGDLAVVTGDFFLDNTLGSIKADKLSISARNIGIISPEILALLEGNPLPAALANLINTPPALPSGEPVISAQDVDFSVGEMLLVQNTGTAYVPAGFEVGSEGLRITSIGQVAPTVMINGQIADGAGNITGADAAVAFKSALVSQTGFADGSQINGCAIVATACGVSAGVSQNPILVAAGVTENQVVAVVSAEVQIVGNSFSGPGSAATSPQGGGSAGSNIGGSTSSAANMDTAAETDAGGGAPDATFEAEPDSATGADAENDAEAADGSTEEDGQAEDEQGDEEQKDEEEAEEEGEEDGPASGPIPALPMLIDTGPLTPVPVVTEPFSSSGNPALQGDTSAVDANDGARN